VAHFTLGKEPLVPTQSWMSPTASLYTVERTVSFASQESNFIPWLDSQCLVPIPNGSLNNLQAFQIDMKDA